MSEVFHGDSISIFISFEINLQSESLLNFFKQGILVLKGLSFRGSFLYRDRTKYGFFIILLQRSQ